MHLSSQDDKELLLGKYRRLSRLSTADGRFAMLAVDQRGSLRRMIARRTNLSEDQVGADDLRLVKRIVTRYGAPLASAVLTDPLYGYPASFDVLPRDVGVLLALEVTGYEETAERERLSRLIDGFSVERALRLGADAVKLLLWFNPEASDETQQHQDEIVRSVGEACAAAEMPFVLELVTYALDGADRKGFEFAARKPDYVIEGARRYSDLWFGVDLLKIEFPANLKYTEGYQDRAFFRSRVVYTGEEVADVCRRLDEASMVPWVILSAGVDLEEFLENIRLANEAGASGFLCGRAVWKHVTESFPDERAMARAMERDGVKHLELIAAANGEALPWFRHPRWADFVRHPAPSHEEAATDRQL